ncbi:hypothetical protein F5Y15DRAFT_374416 [Xylariaceae sp. FL0016]|nr:hypothetical protein F5Y15DRAFT_374416 [Xylariaceae sp. FL0016]
MQALATGARAPGVGEQAEMQGPYVTTYRLLFGNFAIPPGMERNVNWEGVREDISTQILTGGKRAWFAVYEKLEEPTAKRLRYTEEEKERVVAKWGDLYMAPGYKMRDVYKMLEGPVGMINLEEGLVDQWSWKRVVLVGDAVRKLEPHAGLGYNSGVADVVTLVNGLRRLLRTEASPSTASLEALFASYRDDRMRDMPAIVDMSMRRARMCAWLSWGDKMMAKYAIPYLPIGALSVNYILGPIVSRVPVLEWLDESGLPEAAIPYEHHALPVEEREKASLDFRVASRSKSLFGLSNYTTALVLATAATIGLRYYQRV